jgi:hypothetical protein
MSTSSWPPSCRSTPSNCTCCCILTPHTHLSDSAGYPHLNHLIRFPHPDNNTEPLAWFHCPHCPCTLGLNWIHPTEMPLVEESVSTATWLPRVGDFEGYIHLFDDDSAPSPGSPSPMDDVSNALADRKNAANLPEAKVTTPVEHRKSLSDGPRKSTRKSKPTAARLESDWSNGLATPTYKPRKSKYDVR